jgi:hypothetical protein
VERFTRASSGCPGAPYICNTLDGQSAGAYNTLEDGVENTPTQLMFENSDHPRISGLTRYADLGLDTVGAASKTAHCNVNSVLGRANPCHSLGSSWIFHRRTRCGDWRLPILRSSRYANIPMRNLACSCRDRFWNRRRLATELTALARPCFRLVHPCILDNGGSVGMNPLRPERLKPCPTRSRFARLRL